MSLLEPQPDLHPQPSSPAFSAFFLQEATDAASMAATGGPFSMDVLKGNPFLLPAPLLALNPALYAAQLAQLQAAQLLLAKQSLDNGAGTAAAADRRKRAAEDETLLRDLGSKTKYHRFSAGHTDVTELATSSGMSESPLDLSGSRSPDRVASSTAAEIAAAGQAAFSALLPPNIISFLNQLKSCSPAGAAGDFSSLFGVPATKSTADNPSSPPGAGTSAARSNPWQSQWMNRAAADGGQISDVFKCVWCRESYHTLEALTRHMKEAKHHHGLPSSGPPAYSSAGPTMPTHSGGRSMGAPPARMLAPPSTSPGASPATTTTPPKASPPVRDILKEQLPLPRKLVRGQDVWIGRADQQTRDILKCMGCGQSFRSLDLLTKHMQETQHYKKVISHDQLSSWKYQDAHHQGGASVAGGPKNHVNSVLSCKVCDKGFSTLKELSDHMVRANHYATDGKMGDRQNGNNMMSMGSNQAAAAAAASPSSKERKKALPVKKLLELERARQEVAGTFSPVSTREIMESGKLLCERCEERVPIDIFIPHIQQCVGRPRFLKSATSPRTRSPAAGVVKNSHQAAKAGGNSSKEADASFSILGSLEQLVKGNFQGSQAAASSSSMGSHFTVRPAVSSASVAVPLRVEHQFSPEHKFSISSLFPSKVSPVPSSGSSCSSRPVSPAAMRPRSGFRAASEEAPEDCGKRSGGFSPPVNGKQEGSSVNQLSPSRISSERNGSVERSVSSSSPHLAGPGQGHASDVNHIPHQQQAGDSVVSGTAAISPPPAAASPANSIGSAADGSVKRHTMSSPMAPAALSPNKSPSGGGNALAALQMFCEDQRKTTAPRPGSSGGIKEAGGSNGVNMGGSPLSDPGAILAFSWACNQAVSGGGDSAATIKCPFCETPFISKGAYRHHLSKMHFTKENMGSGPSAAFLMPAAAGGTGAAARTPSPDTKDAEESLQSKYQKYSQLAKQLSCYDGTN